MIACSDNIINNRKDYIYIKMEDASPSTRNKASQIKDNKEDEQKIIQWVNEIKDESTREAALGELSRKRESFSDLALYIWYSTGTVSAL